MSQYPGKSTSKTARAARMKIIENIHIKRSKLVKNIW